MKLINPIFKELKWNTRCIILDLDWTLAFMDWKRSPYDYEKVINDRLNDRLMMLVNMLKHWDDNIKTIIVTWRNEDSLPVTKEWLKHSQVEYDEIYTRKDDDSRCDTVVKKEIYDNYIKDRYDVLAVFDDRNRVIDMRREEWLPTYQVWYWDF